MEAALEPPSVQMPGRALLPGLLTAETLPRGTPSRPSTTSVRLSRAGRTGLVLSGCRNLGACGAGQGGRLPCEGRKGVSRGGRAWEVGEGKDGVQLWEQPVPLRAVIRRFHLDMRGSAREAYLGGSDEATRQRGL